MDGRVFAEQIKQIRPTVPIVMLTDSLELPGWRFEVSRRVRDGIGQDSVSAWGVVCFVPNYSSGKQLSSHVT
jgi:hypothetical protein